MKELAIRISRSFIIREIVDEMGGITLGGVTIGDKYFEKMICKRPQSFHAIVKESNSLRHWLQAAGYDEKGTFKIVIANTIQNC